MSPRVVSTSTPSTSTPAPALSPLRAELGSEPLAGLEARPVYRFIKRAFDIVFSILVLVAFSWLYLIVAILIKVDDPTGPIFFRQTRVTKDGREFTMYKFRSMVADADNLEKYLSPRQLEQWHQEHKVDDDPRITKLGRFLRASSIDEFPQFFNVLKGDMSLVGTRPPTVEEWHRYEPFHRSRMSTKPGITGLWQVSGRSEIRDFDTVVRLDR